MVNKGSSARTESNKRMLWSSDHISKSDSKEEEKERDACRSIEEMISVLVGSTVGWHGD